MSKRNNQGSKRNSLIRLVHQFKQKRITVIDRCGLLGHFNQFGRKYLSLCARHDPADDECPETADAPLPMIKLRDQPVDISLDTSEKCLWLGPIKTLSLCADLFQQVGQLRHKS